MEHCSHSIDSDYVQDVRVNRLPKRLRKGVDPRVAKLVPMIEPKLAPMLHQKCVIAPVTKYQLFKDLMWMAYVGSIHERDMILTRCSTHYCVHPDHLERRHEVQRKKKRGMVTCPRCSLRWESMDMDRVRFCRPYCSSPPETIRYYDYKHLLEMSQKIEGRKYCMLRATKLTSLRTLCLMAKAKLELANYDPTNHSG